MTVSLRRLPFVLLGLLPLACAHADTHNEAIIGGALIHSVRTTSDGLSPDQRAAVIQQRVNQALAQGPLHASDFTIGQLDGDWCVLFRGKRFLTVDQATAHQEHSDPKALAEKWAKHLQQVLPPLTSPKGKA